MDSALFLLDKKFAHSWASWSVVAGMSQASIDQVVLGFDKLDKKTKIRFIIALLGLDAARRAALLGSIRKLLELAFNSTDEWLPVIASIVHTRLFPDSSDHGQQQAARAMVDGAEHVLGRILEVLSEEGVAMSGGELQYFCPLEHKYVDPGAATADVDRTPREFVYTGTRPDFLTRERNTQKALAEDTKRGASVLSSRVSTTKLHQDRPSMNGSGDNGNMRRGSGSLLPPKPLYKPAAERKAPIMLPLSQTKELEAAHNLQQKKLQKKRPSESDFTNAAKKSKPTPAANVPTTAPAPSAEKDPAPSETPQLSAAAQPAVKSTASGPDLDTLFSQSPLLTSDDKKNVELFFSDNWKSHFSDSEKIMKFRLKEE